MASAAGLALMEEGPHRCLFWSGFFWFLSGGPGALRGFGEETARGGAGASGFVSPPHPPFSISSSQIPE
ncbi:unnamed protein product [Spirodela intermedia]|uniref:Uncharacterized protein n=1 Tax=Spirodela intermedia TaxID=51605 RepID=A0A7I8KCF0_SPIIN|nr:unnamed protein product [Spirodela intermedia]